VDVDEERLRQGGGDRIHAGGVDEVLVDDGSAARLDERSDGGAELSAGGGGEVLGGDVVRPPRKEPVPEGPALAGPELARGAAERGVVVAHRAAPSPHQPAATLDEAGRAGLLRVAVGEVADVEAIGEQLVEQGAARTRGADDEDRRLRERFAGPASSEAHLERVETPDACSAQARPRDEGQAARERVGHGYS
jgi:hypothetical protein